MSFPSLAGARIPHPLVVANSDLFSFNFDEGADPFIDSVQGFSLDLTSGTTTVDVGYGGVGFALKNTSAWTFSSSPLPGNTTIADSWVFKARFFPAVGAGNPRSISLTTSLSDGLATADIGLTFGTGGDGPFISWFTADNTDSLLHSHPSGSWYSVEIRHTPGTDALYVDEVLVSSFPAATNYADQWVSAIGATRVTATSAAYLLVDDYILSNGP